MANKFMVEICSEPDCGGKLIPQLNGILVCERCGAEDAVSSIDAPHLTNLFKKSYAGGDNSRVPFGKKLRLREVSRALKWLAEKNYAGCLNPSNKQGVKGIVYRLSKEGKKIKDKL